MPLESRCPGRGPGHDETTAAIFSVMVIVIVAVTMGMPMVVVMIVIMAVAVLVIGGGHLFGFAITKHQGLHHLAQRILLQRHMSGEETGEPGEDQRLRSDARIMLPVLSRCRCRAPRARARR